MRYLSQVDFMFNSSKQVSYLRKLLTSYSSSHSRQTVFASASIPQHNRFLHDCVRQKWTKVCWSTFLDRFLSKNSFCVTVSFLGGRAMLCMSMWIQLHQCLHAYITDTWYGLPFVCLSISFSFTYECSDVGAFTSSRTNEEFLTEIGRKEMYVIQ